MSNLLIRRYRHVKDLVNTEKIALPIWDVLTLLDMADRAPLLEAEERYVESMTNLVDRNINSVIAKVAARLEEEKAQATEMPGVAEPLTNGKHEVKLPSYT